MKIGLCEKCGMPTDACYEIRSNKVYLVKFCVDCGRTSSLVSKDSRKWRWKRQLCDYQEPVKSGCSMDCRSCDHKALTKPNTVAIDVTNRCNQRCPICLAYVDAMGFDYHPPIEYFDKIFQHFQHQDSRPNICFFGGEPTVHRDFLEIVRLARSYGFQVQLFTNGIRLANKEYCRELCSLGVQVNFGFDGTRPEIYKALRGDDSLETKRRALENVVEQGVNKLAIISTIAEGINDGNLMELMDFIHQYKDSVSVWAFVPLTPCWDSTQIDLEPTTTECVERMFELTVQGIEFVPTGMMKFQVLSRFFGKQTMGGSHPNCESATLLISDGGSYRPISDYLKVSLSDLLARLRGLDNALAVESAAIPESGMRRRWFDAVTFLRTVRVLRGAIDMGRVFPAPRLVNGLRAVGDLLRGKKIDRILSERSNCKNVLTLMTIPYEDTGGLDDARLKDCPAVFAYEDVDTGAIKTAAFCSWQTVKDDVCRKIHAHYDARSAKTKAFPAREKREGQGDSSAG